MVGDRGQVGMLLRNSPAHVAALLGVLLAGGTVVVINPSRGDDRTTADIAALDLPVLIGGTDDLATLVGRASRIDGGRDIDARRRTAAVGRRRRPQRRADRMSRCGC